MCLILIPILDNPLTFSNPAYPCSFEQGHPNPPRLVLSMPQALSPPYLLGVNLFWNAALIDLSFVGLYHTSTKLDLIKSKNLHLYRGEWSGLHLPLQSYLPPCILFSTLQPHPPFLSFKSPKLIPSENSGFAIPSAHKAFLPK